jgi:SAM-dependent methyltransferase
MLKQGDVCPVCGANDRDRLVLFYIKRHMVSGPNAPDPSHPDRSFKVLHVAPEKGLSKYLMGLPQVNYIAGDIQPRRYYHLETVKLIDLLDIDAEDGEFDLVLCNHVLEHVPDDRKAMRELARVLSPQGRAILQVPISWKLQKTDEGDGSESPQERIRRFGQDDHLRLYSRTDYVSRLKEAGLDVELYDAFEEDEEAAAAEHINPFEYLHVCRRT